MVCTCGEAKSGMILSRTENKDANIYHDMQKPILDCLLMYRDTV